MNARTICLGLGLLLTAGMAQAQPDSLWSRTYGGEGEDYCHSAIQTPDGGFVMAGWTASFGAGGYDFWLMRTDEEGDSLWSRTFGGEGRDWCLSVVQTADGGFALAGVTFSFGVGGGDFWLVRTDEEGDSLWSKTFGGEGHDECNSIIPTAGGGFALAGYTGSFGAGLADVWLVRTDGDGDSLWSRTFGGARTDNCHSIIQTANGGFTLGAWTESFGAGSKDFWLLRTDANGDYRGSRTFGGGGEEKSNSIVRTGGGGYLLTGHTTSFGAGREDFWLVRTDEDGDSLWSKTFGGEDLDGCHHIIQTADRGFALAGYTRSFGAGLDDFWLLRTDAEGDSLWSRAFGGGDDDWCSSVIPTADGGFALAGVTGSFGAGGDDFWLVKTTPDPVSVRKPSVVYPSSFILYPSFPTPFNSMTTISFSLDKSRQTSLEVFDPLGRRVAELIPSQVMCAGLHSVVWDAKGVPAGGYVVKLEAGNNELTQRLSLVK